MTKEGCTPHQRKPLRPLTRSFGELSHYNYKNTRDNLGIYERSQQMKLITELSNCILFEMPNDPRRKENYKTRTAYERPFEYVIASKNQDKAWTIHRVAFLGPYKSFIITSTGDGFKDPLEAAMWVNDLLANERLEAAE
jgi:hypothetical protein